MSSVSEIFDRSQIQKSEYAVYAGFDEFLIKSGVGYIEQIHVFVSAEVNADSPLLAELGRLFSPFSSILFTGSCQYHMPVFKAGVDGDIWNFDERTYFTASKFADGGSSAKTPLTVISLSQTPRLVDRLVSHKVALAIGMGKRTRIIGQRKAKKETGETAMKMITGIRTTKILMTTRLKVEAELLLGRQKFSSRSSPWYTLLTTTYTPFKL